MHFFFNTFLLFCLVSGGESVKQCQGPIKTSLLHDPVCLIPHLHTHILRHLPYVKPASQVAQDALTFSFATWNSGADLCLLLLYSFSTCIAFTTLKSTEELNLTFNVTKCLIKFRNKNLQWVFNITWAAKGGNKSKTNQTCPIMRKSSLYGHLDSLLHCRKHVSLYNEIFLCWLW